MGVYLETRARIYCTSLGSEVLVCRQPVLRAELSVGEVNAVARFQQK